MGSSRDLMDEEVEDVRTTCLPPSQMKGATARIGSVVPYPHGNYFIEGSSSIVGASPTTASEMVVMTPHGKVKINLDTGVLTIPHGIGREEAIRDFWLGFQENFRGAERVKYETEIDSLKRDISHITQKAEEYKKEVNKIVKDTIVKKVSEKYGNEKFIMIKPADLIKFIEGT